MTALMEIPVEIQQERSGMVEQARALKIIDQDSYDLAAHNLGVAKLLEDRIVAHYEPLRESTYAAYQTVLDAKKRDLEPVLEVKKLLARGIGEYEVEQERLRQERQKKQDEEAAKAAAAKRDLDIKNAKEMGATREEVKAMKAEPVSFVSPTVDPTHRHSKFLKKPTEQWSAEVLGDEGLLLLVKTIAAGKAPLRLIQPNMVALNAMARTLKEQMNIPGVKSVRQYSTAVKSN